MSKQKWFPGMILRGSAKRWHEYRYRVIKPHYNGSWWVEVIHDPSNGIEYERGQQFSLHEDDYRVEDDDSLDGWVLSLRAEEAVQNG